MDHKDALRIQAVDRYLLGELTAVERDEFEEHFFSCGECSEDLNMGAILVDNSRAVLREEFPDPVPASPAVPPRPGWRLWWSQVPLAAAFALLAVVGYQNLKVLPEYRRQLAEDAGAAVPPRFAVRPAVRGDVQVVPLPKGVRFFEIGAEDVEPAAEGYSCEILDDRGNSVFRRFHAPPVAADGKLNVLLDARRMAPGQYVLVVGNSSNNAELGRYPFIVEIK
jgi:Putative zinc-finger